MNILIIHQYFLEEDEPGGSRFNEFAKMWTDQGHHVTVIAGMVHAFASHKREEYRGKFVLKKKQDSTEVIRCYVSSEYNKSFRGRLWGYFSFVISGLYAGLFTLGRRKFDVVISTSPPLFVGIIGFVISKLRRAKWVFEVRDLWPESAIDTGVLKNKFAIKLALWLERAIYRSCDLIVVLTPSFKSSLIASGKARASKIEEIPNAADLEMIDNAKKKVNIDKLRGQLGLIDKKVIIYVGAHGVANALDQILDTAKLLHQANVVFLLIGDGMEKNRLQRRAKEENIQNVVFLQSVPKHEVYQYILASDIGTSVLKKVDTFKTVYSNKTFDYMGCEKPILMAIDGASRSLIETAKCGLFVDPENPQDFAQKTSVLLDDDGLRSEMGRNGFEFVKCNFERRVLADKYIRLMLNLAGRD
jgi:glycosyltransferase involved in cell wall biosynthesis